MDAKQDVWRAIPALMGDGDGTIEVPNQPGYVYIRIGDGDLGQAFNNRCPLRDNLAIYVGYDPVTDPERRIFQVLSVRMSDYANAGNTPIANVPPHHTYHEFGGGDDVYIDWRRLLGFRVGRPAGFVVTVDQGVMMRAGAWTAIVSQTVNLAASQPGGINNARYVLVSLDSAGVVTTSNGAIVSAAALTISNCPAPAAGEIPLAAVRLYSTQTQISDVPGTPDIVDLRFPQVYATGGSNVFGSGVANQFAYWAAADTLTGSAQVTRSSDICLIATKAATALAPGTYTIGVFSNVSITAALAQSGHLRAFDAHVTTGGAVNYTGELVGYEDLLYHSGTGTASAMYGLGCIIDVTSTGTISDAAVVFGGLTAGASGVITTGYGVHIDAPIGSIGTYYGIYIETCAAATTKWAFYAEGNKITTKQAAAAGIELDPNAATGNFTLSLSPANLTGNRRHTLPDYNMTWPAADAAGVLTSNGAGVLSWGAGGGAHAILSATHTDTLADSVVDGDVIIGNVTPKWSRLAISIPAANVRNVLGVDNGELRPSWKTALDATAPTTIAESAAAAAGTSLVFSHRDHTHGAPATWAATAHAVDSATHTVAGGTAGKVLIETGAATFGWSGFLLSGTAGGMTNFDVANTKTLTLSTAQDISLTWATGIGALLSLTYTGPYTLNLYPGTLDLDGRSLSLLNGSIQLDVAAGGGGLRAIIIPSDGTLVLGTGTQYQLAVWNGTNTIAGLGGLGTSGAVLQSAGAGANPGWSTFYLAGTAAQTYTFPAAGGTVAMLNAANAFTDSNTVASGKFLTCLTDGNTGGLRAGSGSDVLWYRGAADRWQTPDSVTIDGSLLVSTSPISMTLNTNGSIAVTVNNANAGAAAQAGFVAYSDVVTASYIAYSSGAGGGARLNLFASGGYILLGTSTNHKVDFYTNNTLRASLPAAGGFTVVAGFGCNGAAAQTAYASGGALAAYGAGTNGLDTGANMSALHALVVKIRAALVANGIMS